MKTPVRILQFPAAAVVAALALGAATAFAASGTWTNNIAGNGSGSWAGAVNWTNGVIADGADSPADFSTLDITADSVVTLDGARTIGNVTFGDTASGNNWFLNTGTGGPLALSVTSGQPTLSASSGSNVIGAVLQNTALPSGITKTGNGWIRLNGANLMTNAVHNINAGALLVGNNNGLGYTNNAAANVISNVVNSGGTLWIAAGVQPAHSRVFLSGTGAGGTNGALRADAGTAANQQNTRLSFTLNTVANPAFVLTSDATIRVDGNTNHAGFLVGVITNNALGLNYTLTKTGTAELRPDPAVNIAVSNIVIAEGVFGFNGSGNISGSQVVTVNPGAIAGSRRNLTFNSASSILNLNGTLALCYNTGAANDAIGFDQRVGVLTGNGTVVNTIQKNYTTFRVQSSTSNSLFSGTFDAGTNGPIVLRKSGAGTSLRLTGSSSYKGTNFVEAGSLIVDGVMNPDGGYTVNSGASLAGAGTILVPITLNSGSTLAAGSSAGTLTVSNVVGVGDVYVTNANLTSVGQLNTTVSGVYLNSLNLTNSTVTVPLQQGGTEASIHATTLNVDGTNNTLAFTTGNPATGVFPFIKCSALGGLDGFAGLKLQPPVGVGAVLSNNVGTDGTIYVVITNIPALVWRGTPTGDWSIGGSANWLSGVTPTAYTETAGLGPFVNFDDTLTGNSAVNLTTNVTPKGVTVNNSASNYVFTGSGSIGGTSGILKQGTAALTLANDNAFSGSINISAGTVQVGNNGTTGNLGGGSVINSGTLVFRRTDNVTFSNTISSAGSLVNNGAGTVTLAGIGSVGGAVTVSNGALALGPAGTITVTGDVTGGGAFGVNGPGVVALDGFTVNYSGGSIISNGTLQFNNALPPSGAISDNGTLAVGVSGTLPNNISGSGGLSIINGAGITLGGANSYSGVTRVLGGGSLTTDTANYPAASVLQLGSITGSADTGSATFTLGNPVLGGLSAGGNSTSPGDPINLAGSGQTLTINGNVTVGNSGIGYSVYLPVTGTGATIAVNTNGGVIQLGLSTAGSGVNPDNVFVDFSTVDTFIANLGTNGLLNLGTTDGNPGPPAGATVVNWFNLAAVSNNITAGTINIGAGGRQLIPELRLGAGANILNVNTLATGPGGRDGGNIHFLTGTGTLKLRANDGVSGALFNVGVNPATGTGASISNSVDLTGHSVDLLLSGLVIGNYNNAGIYYNTFAFDTGTLDTPATSLSVTRNNNGNAAVSGSVLNIGGGTANLGAVSLTASAAFGTLNISNATVTVSNITSAGSGVATLSLDSSTLNTAIGAGGNPVTAPVIVDSLATAGTVNLGVQGTNFSVGQFPLLSYTGGFGGSGYPAFALSAIPGYGAHLSNNVANLSVDVVITSAPATVASNPTNITFSASGGNLNLSWPSDHLGWILQSQTNSRSVGLSNNWFDVPGSLSLTATNFPVNATNPTVFFRLRHP